MSTEPGDRDEMGRAPAAALLAIVSVIVFAVGVIVGSVLL